MDDPKHPTTAHRRLPNWSNKGRSSFADRVLKWSDENFSDFPWRHHRSPYEILVAEVLLKRTTATAAARIYEDFLTRFPSLYDIASAPEEELVEALSSVGLQRQRARSMRRLADWLLRKHDGDVPNRLEDLLEVPGLGDYSAKAILSFGHGVPAAVLDANVERILLRVFANSLPSHPNKTLLHEVAEGLLPGHEHRNYNYGLLDLGRLTCRYVDPRCGKCPLASDCDFLGNSSKERDDQVRDNNSTYSPSRLRVIRHNRGISLKRLAKVANVSKLTVIRIESGRTSPRRETLEKLAQALCVQPDELVG